MVTNESPYGLHGVVINEFPYGLQKLNGAHLPESFDTKYVLLSIVVNVFDIFCKSPGVIVVPADTVEKLFFANYPTKA